jgi:hypothetical protein
MEEYRMTALPIARRLAAAAAVATVSGLGFAVPAQAAPATPTTTSAVGMTTASTATGLVPPAVVAAASTGGGSGEVAVNWNAVPGATGYRVLRTNTAGRHPRLAADFNITTGHTTAAPNVVNIWSAEHSYLPDFGPLTQVDQSPWFQYVDLGADRRCYRVLAYNSAGAGPRSAVTCASPPGA